MRRHTSTPVAVGQSNVEQHQINLGRSERGGSGRRDGHLVTTALERTGQRRREPRIILHEKHSHLSIVVRAEEGRERADRKIFTKSAGRSAS